MKKWEKVFKGFCNEYLNLTDRSYTTENDFKDYPLDADMFCTGSDQVWNPEYINSFEWSFALFANESQRIVYAASLGVDKIPERYLPQFTKSLQA